MERGLRGGVTQGLSRTVSHVVWSVEGGRLRKHGRSRVLFDATCFSRVFGNLARDYRICAVRLILPASIRYDNHNINQSPQAPSKESECSSLRRG
jgi:hypothetical protein